MVVETVVMTIPLAAVLSSPPPSPPKSLLSPLPLPRPLSRDGDGEADDEQKSVDDDLSSLATVPTRTVVAVLGKGILFLATVTAATGSGSSGDADFFFPFSPPWNGRTNSSGNATLEDCDTVAAAARPPLTILLTVQLLLSQFLQVSTTPLFLSSVPWQQRRRRRSPW